MSNMFYEDEERRRLLERLLGGRTGRQGEFAGRGRAQGGRMGRGGPAMAIMSMLGARRAQGGGVGRGGMGQAWQGGVSPNASNFQAAPPRPPVSGAPGGFESALSWGGRSVDTGPTYPYLMGDLSFTGQQSLIIPPWLKDYFPNAQAGGRMRME